MKKKLPLILVVLLVIGGGIFAFAKSRSKPTATDEPTKKKRIEEPTNIIAVADRPYIQILPHSDGHNLSLEVVEVKKDATSVEYELEYQAGSLLQGAFGQLSFDSLPATKKILLGSCSAGGACTYHEDVQGGTLLTRFNGPESYALKSRWKYIINSKGEMAFSSQDAKFQIESKGLAKQSYLVIFNTAGYPTGLESEPVSDLYSMTTASKLSGSGELTIRAEEEGELMIMGYDGSKWQEFKTTTDGKMATATVDLMELYVVVK
jgi:hypothetical protein